MGSHRNRRRDWRSTVKCDVPHRNRWWNGRSTVKCDVPHRNRWWNGRSTVKCDVPHRNRRRNGRSTVKCDVSHRNWRGNRCAAIELRTYRRFQSMRPGSLSQNQCHCNYEQPCKTLQFHLFSPLKRMGRNLHEVRECKRDTEVHVSLAWDTKQDARPLPLIHSKSFFGMNQSIFLERIPRRTFQPGELLFPDPR